MFHKTRRKFTVLFTALVATCLLLVPGCGSDSSSDEKPLIVVTTNILGDVVSKAVGDVFNVETIMPPGSRRY